MQDKNSRRPAAYDLVIGVLTFIPAVYLPTILVTEGDLPIAFSQIQVLHFTVMLLYLGLLVFYVREALGRAGVDPEARAMWAVLVVVFGPLAQIIFFMKYMLLRRAHDH